MIFLFTLFPVYFSFCATKLQAVCINAYFFYNQNFICYVFSRFLSIEQSTALLLGHNKTPPLSAKPTGAGVVEHNIIF